jgi:hypothetical protein
MKLSNLKINSIYIDITDKTIPLQFTGKVEKNVNLGLNNYVNIAYFKPIKTEENKNWFENLDKIIKKYFDYEIENNCIVAIN